MTLFKKVFGTHSVGSPDAPTPLEKSDSFEFNDLTEEDIVAKLAFGSVRSRPVVEKAVENATEVEEMPEPDEPEQGQAEPAAPKPPQPTMAELAAAAQKHIELTRHRYAAGKSEAAKAPLPAEKAADTAPADAVPRPSETQEAVAPVPPASPRPGRSAKRARTRLIGFDQGDEAVKDPFDKIAGENGPREQVFPVGWFVIVAGPGRGHAFAIFNGASTIGRGDDQIVRLDFGDTSISRQNHAAVAYDDEQNKFYLGHGGKSNIIRLNDRPVLSTEELSHADIIRIGETTLRFVALCGAEFNWGSARDDDD